jgi:branched-chain amino acid transport system substrate-binding protein
MRVKGIRRLTAAIAGCTCLVACGSYHSQSTLVAAAGTRVAQTATSVAAGPAAATGPTAVAAAPTSPGAAPAATLNASTGQAAGAASVVTTPTGSPVAGVTSPQGCATELSPVVLGTVGEQTGVFGSILYPGVQAVQAWVKSVNAGGGLRCHPVQYLVEDDGGDPSTDQAEVQSLVEQHHVIAFVDFDAPLAGNASVAYLTQHRIPVIGSEGGSPWFYNSPMYFPQQTSGSYILEGIVAGVAAYGKSLGLTKYGQVTCIEAAQCSGLYNQAPAYAQKFGLQLVYRGQGSLTQPDFTSTCQAAQRAGAQMFGMGLDTNSDFRLLRNCNSVGFHPVFVTGGALATPGLAQYSLANGTLIVMGEIPPSHLTNPSLAQFQSVLHQYAPGLNVDTGTMNGWVSAQLLAAASADISDPPTSDSILRGLWTISNNDLGGITQPLTFTANQNAPTVVCYWAVKIQSGTYVDVGNGARICL